MNRQWLFLAALCAAAAVHAAQEQQVYKWTDAAGIVHYSDAPPPKDVQNVQTVRVTGGDRPHAVPTENTEAATAAAAANGAGQQAANGPVADTPDNRAKACSTARRNLELLQSKYAVAVTGPDGKPAPMDDKARQSQITDANAQVTLFCK